MKYSNIFDGSDNYDVYSKTGAPMVERVLEGFNSSIVSYGGIGTGKTYTLYGPLKQEEGDEALGKEDFGLAHHSVDHILSYSETNFREVDLQLSISFFCVKQDKVYDLLTSRKDGKGVLKLVDGQRVYGLSETTITSVEEFHSLIR